MDLKIFVKKPPVVEAIKVDVSNISEINEIVKWINLFDGWAFWDGSNLMVQVDVDNIIKVKNGYWVVKDGSTFSLFNSVEFGKEYSLVKEEG